MPAYPGVLVICDNAFGDIPLRFLASLKVNLDTVTVAFKMSANQAYCCAFSGAGIKNPDKTFMFSIYVSVDLAGS